jgi:endo-1,4-beta-xylanase
MKKNLKNLLLLSLLCISVSCEKDAIESPKEAVASNNIKASTARITTDVRLKDLSGYPIGIETEYSVIQGNNATALDLLKNQYSSFTMRLYTSELYTGSDSNNWGTLSFVNPDKLYDFARNNSYSRVFGHCLVYHSGLASGQESYIGSHTTAQFEAAIKTHIESIVNHYKAKGMANRSYDVMNEIIEDASTSYRNTVFRQKYLTDADYLQFIIRCFKWAKTADPAAKLFYNDYNWDVNPAKRQRIINLVNAIKNPANNIIANGVSTPIIDGVGLQSHLDTTNFGVGNNFGDALTTAVGTGLLVHISELDVSINLADQSESVNPYTEALKQKQTDIYRRVPQIYYNNVPASQRFGITMWDLNDFNSWVPKSLRPNSHYDKATLYDDGFGKKPCYWGMASGLAGYTLLPTDKSFTITPQNYTDVMFDAGANAVISTTAYTGNNNQKWTLDHQGNGVYKIRNNATGGYISGSAGATANGTALISNTVANNSQLVKITALDNGVYSLIVGANQGFDRNASNGKMQFYGYWGGANQKMKLEIK